MKYLSAILAVLALVGFAVCSQEPDTVHGGDTPSPPVPQNPWPDTPVTITNDSFWKDTDGNPIYSQSGGVFDFVDPAPNAYKHYWYGIRYGGAEEYYNAPYQNASTDHSNFVSITCYSSTDLANWKFEGDVFTRSQVTKNYLGRMGAAYVKEIHKYVLVIQYHEQNNSSISEMVLAWADSPTGPFSIHRILDMPGETTIYTGDQTVFTDDDGTSYLVCSKGSGRDKIYVFKIAWDAAAQQVYFANPKNLSNPKDFSNLPLIYSGPGMEGNCMFKYEGKYYNTGSELFGWNASPAKYHVADGSIVGSYRPASDKAYTMVNAEKDYSHVSQTGFYYTLKGTKQTTVIYCGDRWADFCSNGLGYNQWVPLTIDGDTVVFNSLSQWTLNPKTGEWAAAEGNNYVLNGAFEADRVALPTPGGASAVAGWTYSGTTAAIKNESSGSSRVGKFHLAFTMSGSPFAAGVSQEITLPNGVYTLRADVRASTALSGAATAELYADTAVLDLKTGGSDWAAVTLPVTVTGGHVTVGVRVDGVPGGQWLNIDNITLVQASYAQP
jgi:hypothetical protein